MAQQFRGQRHVLKPAAIRLTRTGAISSARLAVHYLQTLIRPMLQSPSSAIRLRILTNDDFIIALNHKATALIIVEISQSYSKTRLWGMTRICS